MQIALERHSQRKKFIAMQVTMQNTSDVAKYVVVFTLHRPDE
jgi:hypothetical protein